MYSLRIPTWIQMKIDARTIMPTKSEQTSDK